MSKRRLTLADAALARHLREEATKTTADVAEARQLRRYVLAILLALLALAGVIAWAFFDVFADLGPPA